MWSDDETTEDLLGFKVYADLIYEMVSDPSILPLTIGVFADWGGGKSSVLRMLERKITCLNEEDGQFCLYVNGWLFEGYDDAKSALISSILAQLRDHPTLGKRLKDKIVPLLRSVDYMRYLKLGLGSTAIGTALASIGVDLSAVMTVVGAFFPSPVATTTEGQDAVKDELIAIRDFREQFGNLLSESKITSLVILIDDLDRCDPRRIIENLEAIKLFLNVDHTAFVIGADPRLVAHAIRLHHRGISRGADTPLKEEDQIVQDYLEKIINVPFHLPRLSVPEVQTYMMMLFCQHELKGTDGLGRCLDALYTHIQGDRYTAISRQQLLDVLHDDDDGQLDALAGLLEFSETAAPLVGEGLKGNPRLIKRFLNTYLVRSQMAQIANVEGFDPAIMVKLMVLEYGALGEHQRLYEFVRRGKGQSEELTELETLCGQESAALPEDGKWPATPFLVRWARMAPKLAGIDLRDYFWLSRDRMEGTLGQLDMLPPHIKRMVVGLSSESPALQKQTARELTAYESTDIAAVLAEMGRQLIAAPDRNIPYLGFMECVESGVAKAEESLAAALRETDTAKMNASMGLRLLTLQQRSSCSPDLRSVIGEIAESKTSIGAVMRKSSKPKGAKR